MSMTDRLMSRLSPRAQSIFCSLYVLPAVGLAFFIAWVIQVCFTAATYLFISPVARADGCGNILRFVAHALVDRLNPFWHVHLLNPFPMHLNRGANDPTQKIILVMPHLSSADPFLSIRGMRPRDGTWVAKASLFGLPLGGWAMGNADDLPVYFVDKHGKAGPAPAGEKSAGGMPTPFHDGKLTACAAALEEEEEHDKDLDNFDLLPGTTGPMMERARAKLRRGRMLCVFPEGTRSQHAGQHGYLAPFRRGFFDLALEEGALLVPLAITGTDRAWPRRSVLTSPANCYLSFGDVIDAKDFDSSSKLSECVRAELIRRMDAHPDRCSVEQ